MKYEYFGEKVLVVAFTLFWMVFWCACWVGSISLVLWVIKALFF